MLTDRPGLTTATDASATAEPLLFPSSLLSIILLLTPCTFNLVFFRLCLAPTPLRLSVSYVCHIPLLPTSYFT